MNRGNAKVGAGDRQREYQKTGRVKRQAANGQMSVNGPGSQQEKKRENALRY